MNNALKHTIIAMATAALGLTAGCSSDSPEGSESSSGGETATEHSCSGEGSCSGATEGESSCSGDAESSDGAAEASCGEGSCG